MMRKHDERVRGHLLCM